MWDDYGDVGSWDTGGYDGGYDDWGSWGDTYANDSYDWSSGGGSQYDDWGASDFGDWSWSPPAAYNQDNGSWQNNYDYTPTASDPTYALQANNPQQMAQRYMEMGGGSPQRALALATAARTGPFENNPTLRDASHQLLSEEAVRRLPGIAHATLPVASAGYSLAKWLAQNLPGGHYADSVMKMLGMDPLYNASPPSWGEVYSGAYPALRDMRLVK